MLLYTKDDFIKANKIYGFAIKDIDVIFDLVDLCIQNLYMLDSKIIKCADRSKIKDIGVDNEAINFGDLHCCEVIKVEGEDRYIATIEEAASDSREFQNYIEDWLARWGWQVEIKTEW